MTKREALTALELGLAGLNVESAPLLTVRSEEYPGKTRKNHHSNPFDCHGGMGR